VSDVNPAIRTWLERLKAAHPIAREEAIKQLELLGDTEALPALADAFATDPEPELRALAQSAGKAIYYAAIRRQIEDSGPSDEERRRAADILAQARARKTQDGRRVE